MVRFKCPSQTCREPDLGLQLTPPPQKANKYTQTHQENSQSQITSLVAFRELYLHVHI